MSDTQIYRIIDVNLDRAGEGLRVLEEIARFVLGDPVLSARFKEVRHNVALRDMQAKITFLSSRDAACDVGENIKTAFQFTPRHSLSEIAFANARRAEESLRVLEEFAPSVKLNSQNYATARYQLYTLEKDILGQLSRHNKTQQISGLCVVVDTVLLRKQNALEITAQILDSGAKMLQLCDNTIPKGELLELACAIQKLCAAHNALFIVSDHLDIVLSSNADGILLKQEDMPISIARRYLPLDKIIGCSINTKSEAQKAQQDGADYIVFEAGFGMLSRSELPSVEPETIESIKQAVKLPLIAIGDIGLQNTADVFRAGADAVAVSSTILSASSPINTPLDLA